MSAPLKPLKMYTAGSRYPSEYSVVAACVARTHKEAKKLLWAGSGNLRQECDWQFTDLRVSRSKSDDQIAASIQPQEPHVIEDTAITRQMGWFCSGDAGCSCCGLYEMDGDFPLCQDCGFCAECGHDEKCVSKQPC